MNIGFDAKRAFQNSTGLGNYSRTIISLLASLYPEHAYYLFAPKITSRFNTSSYKNIHTISPAHFPSTLFKSAWRSKWVISDLIKHNINIYHGLSHEIPVGIHKTPIKSVVTIHDLIFERYPHQYHPIDNFTYRKKFKHACRYADQIIAISEQTRTDIIELYKIAPEKITVCRQNCNPAFNEIISDEKKALIRSVYQLPPQFYLSVGSIIERKNLMLICQAMKQLNTTIPLVVIGNGGAYKQQVKNYINQNGLANKIIFLSESAAALAAPGFDNAADFPAIYQLATAMIYPSIYEGFGLPIVEAMSSRLPVICSNVSCMPETGGDAALYVNPADATELAEAMDRVAHNTELRQNMIAKGLQQVQQFSEAVCTRQLMQVYTSL